VDADSIPRILARAADLDVRELIDSSRAYQDRERTSPMVDAVRVAIGRSGHADEARATQRSASQPVTLAATRIGRPEALTRLGIVFDAQAAVADAVLAIFRADRSSPEVADRLAEPWRRVIDHAEVA
jgi:hypothetical protein